jgi:uncharacterized protein (TIGR02757 family)
LKIWQPGELKTFLDMQVEYYNRPEFIATDPVQIPHRFTLAQDIEISGFIAATLAWGQRKTIISKSSELMHLMDYHPYDFLLHAGIKDYARFEGFCHRTFNATDTLYFLQALKNIYLKHGGLRKVFETGFMINHNAAIAIACFREFFFELDHPARTRKHVPDVMKGAAAKRLNMFLRWMVRRDKGGIDFGLWKNISPAWLKIPLDLHTAKTARSLELLKRKQNDWKAVCELTDNLSEFDAGDPVKYDYALFGMSAAPTGWGDPVGVV